MGQRDKAKPGAPRVQRQRETPLDRARIGSVIAGTYRIDEMIGRGAIGAVFGGVHLRLERPLAIKFVDSTLVDEPDVRARFKREAKIAAQIGSSHAVEVFDYGLGDDGAPYLVMERLYGEDLHARMQREGRLPVERALRIAKQVCRALGAAHTNGIVHRDLKPENVFLVERDGEQEFVKVVDFGLSTFVQSDETRLTRAGQSVGTPLYMAPEQAGAREFDARVDVYSLGVLIFEMTTGRLPFEATNLHSLLVALATDAPRTLRHYAPELPVELEELVTRFISRDPRGRPRSAAAALAEIIALEARLLAKTPSAPPTANGVAALAGELEGAFARDVHNHLDQLRRTGSLVTAPVDDGALPPPAPAEPTDTGPPSSAGDQTRPMLLTELTELMAPHSNAPKPQPLHRDEGEAPSKPAGAAPASARGSERRAAPDPRLAALPRLTPDNEDDSRVSAHPTQPMAHRVRVHKQPSGRRGSHDQHASGPPPAVLWIALAAFVIVAALVLIRILR